MNDNDPASPNANGDAAASTSLIELMRAWLRGLGTRRNGNLREALEEVIKSRPDEEAPIDPEEHTMLVNLLNFGELQVDDVMVPRADIVAIEQGAPLDEVVDTMRGVGHSRLPVFRDTLDDIIGMIHVRDLLPYWNTTTSFALARRGRRAR